MSYLLVVDEAAQDDLDDLAADLRARLLARIEELTERPKPGASKELTGSLRGYRSLRVGDYRIGYSLDEKAGEVTVWAVGHRRNIYERLARRGA